MPISRTKTAGYILSRAKIRAISPPGKSRGYWTKLPRMQGFRRQEWAK